MVFLLSCRNEEGNKAIYIELQGNAQGTTFSIKYGSVDSTDLRDEVAAVLSRMDSVFSSYVDHSLITYINTFSCDSLRDSLCTIPLGNLSADFKRVFERSMEIFLLTERSFNPAVMPLVRYWGFDKNEVIPEKIDSSVVDSLLRLTDFSLVRYNGEEESSPRLIKPEHLQLDFNAIAQGYTVDVIAELLMSEGIHDFMIELGGEVRTKGVNENGITWSIGIDKPVVNNNDHELQTIIVLDGKALATSGNYRKFYEKNGERFTHTIDPATGFPARHNLLSATVIADDCASADAFATAFMVMGSERTKAFLAGHYEEKLEVLLIYSDEKNNIGTWMSEELKKRIKKQS